jgi:hypothetical protein
MAKLQRLKICAATGAVLGVVCIAGAWARSGFGVEAYYLFAFWYNRFLMGVIIGIAGQLTRQSAYLRGALLGLLVSFAFYSATGFLDPVGFVAGIFYGVIIEYAALRYAR